MSEPILADAFALAVPPEVAARLLRVSRSTMFSLLKDGAIESVLIAGRCRRVPIASLNSYLARLRTEQRGEGQRGEVTRI